MLQIYANILDAEVIGQNRTAGPVITCKKKVLNTLGNATDGVKDFITGVR